MQYAVVVVVFLNINQIWGGPNFWAVCKVVTCQRVKLRLPEFHYRANLLS